LTGAPALAERPLPSYRTALGLEAWHEVDRHLEAAARLRASLDPDGDPEVRRADAAEARDELHAAIATAQAFEETVTETSGLAYLTGLAWQQLGEDRRAEAAWRRSIRLDPQGAVDAWHDLGMLLAAREAWDEADEAFAQVALHRTTGPQAWLGPLRRAEVAGYQGDADALESHLEEALRRGFHVGWMRGQPQWRTFHADPRTHEAVDKVLRIYGDPDLRRDVATPPP
jgi:tetratricopeptide (TPR) repeat protein